MPDRSKPTYDVIVVGSGASGGWACKRLSEAGVKVALVDAGRPQPDTNFNEHKPLFDFQYRERAQSVIRRTRPIQKDCYACMEANYDWFCNDLEEPYTSPEGKPFSWQGRLRVTGGRTNVWGRVSLRLSDLDFKAASFDGYGEDWPISYKDVAPYYDIVEEYVGVCGKTEGLAHLPDGKFQPPMNLTCAEVQFCNRVRDKLGWVPMHTRSANLTRGINGRGPCHYCGPCERGCVTHSYFNSAFTTVADALKAGNCTHIPNAMGYKVLMDSDRNRAKGLLYVDRISRQPKEVYGRAVVLCAQSLESVRILLNSADRRYPAGLANSSGVLGHYLMDHIMGGGANGEFPQYASRVDLNTPRRPAGIYVARFRNLPGSPRSKKFLRGYGYEGGGGRVGINLRAAGFGNAYKQAVSEGRCRIGIGGFGECLARWENYVEIDPDLKDAFGIPVLRIHMTYGDNELAMVQDMADSAAEMLEAAGGKSVRSHVRPSQPGWAIHEVGIARMGNDPRKSVLNRFQQTHDVKNVFVCDGAGFTSTACQNPTLTIMTLCVRSMDYLMQEMKRGNV